MSSIVLILFCFFKASCYAHAAADKNEKDQACIFQRIFSKLFKYTSANTDISL